MRQQTRLRSGRPPVRETSCSAAVYRRRSALRIHQMETSGSNAHCPVRFEPNRLPDHQGASYFLIEALRTMTSLIRFNKPKLAG